MFLSSDIQKTRFFPGDLVMVRPLDEILATLDEKGTLGKLPFMPEMREFCGRQFRVSRRAFKTCVDDAEMRQIDDTVFLEDVRCGGEAHGGCDKACLIFWKEAWLRPAGDIDRQPATRESKINELDLFEFAKRGDQFFCQSSEIVNASKPLPWWEPRQYALDLLHNRISIALWLKGMFIAFYNKIAHVTGRQSWRFVAGPAS